MLKDYELHVTKYVLRYFKHLMSDAERAADSAVVLIGDEDGEEEISITFPAGLDIEATRRARVLLADGHAVFRRRLRDRILSDHKAEIFENACPRCGKLPATPRAKYCLLCAHSWSSKPGSK